MEWQHKGLPPQNSRHSCQLANIMANVLWHSEGMSHVHYYSNWLHNDVHKAFQKIKPGKLTNKSFLLHDNTCLRMADLMMTLATVGWKIMNHPPFSSDLAPSDFN
jgi:hypothetical protein